MDRPKKKYGAYIDDRMNRPVDFAAGSYSDIPDHTFDEEDMELYSQLFSVEYTLSPIEMWRDYITSDEFQTPIGKHISELYYLGKPLREMRRLTGLSAESIGGYLACQKAMKIPQTPEDVAELLQKVGCRADLIEMLSQAIDDDDEEAAKGILWQTLVAFEEYHFKTSKGLLYFYTIKGNEIFVSRKKKSVTRASVNYALVEIMKARKEGKLITGPKMLGCFGASYLYPIFIRLGLLKPLED